MEQSKFLEIIESLREIAVANGNKIDKAQIDGAFEGADELTEEKLKLVYAYLKTSKIEVCGIDSSDIAPVSNNADDDQEDGQTIYEKDMEFVKMYQSDIKSLETYDETKLFMLMREKNTEQIIELFLKDVVKWAKTYKEGSVLLGDLIQEGNLALTLAIAGYDYGECIKLGEAYIFDEKEDKKELSKEAKAIVAKLKTYVKEAVTKACLDALYEQESENNVGYKIAGRVNAVNEAAKELSKDYGRKVTIEEVAQKMEMDYEDIKEIVDLSSNKIEYIQ